MASVTLTQVWLALASDLSAPVVASTSGFAPMGMVGGGTMPGSDTRKGGGTVRPYAGGRFRNVTIPGILRVYSLTLRNVPGTAAPLLEGWINQTVLFRDRTGRRVWGVYNDLAVYDYPGLTYRDLRLAVTEVSYDESV